MSGENEQAETPADVKDESVNLDATATAEEVKDEPKPEVAEGETETAGEEEAGGEDKPKKLSGAARAKIREARLLAENNELQRRLEEATRQKPAPDASDSEKPPKEEDFNGDWFAFQRALTAYDAGKTIRDELRKDRETREASERQSRQVAIARERKAAHDERVLDAKDTITDFDEVVAKVGHLDIRNEVINEIISSDQSALLTYHLALHPEKLQALNGMTSRELAREIGRLEGSLSKPAAKKQTTAPPPLTPLKGGAAGSFDPEKASMDDYVAKRKAGWKG